jgi:hypothetical protein
MSRRHHLRGVFALSAGLLCFAAYAGAASAGGGWQSGPVVTEDPPLAQSSVFDLGSAAGNIHVVVYDGNEQASNSTVTTPLTGFTAPAAPLTAKTTYVVVDGQCGPRSPNGCSGVQTAGSGDTLSFVGGGGSLTDGPDAFKGSDGCPWGTDTCLWDTRTFDVSNLVSPGDSSATVSITSGNSGDGTDCINHEAQVLAVGPAAAWASAGYVAAGTGLRNQGSGSITIAGIPSGAKVQKAILYWNVLNSSSPGGGMLVNGASAAGQLVASGPDPCWDGGSWAFRADVTSQVTGNGSYTLSGYPTGSVSGANPWNGSPTPMMEGASLIVFYESASTFKVSFSTFIPTNYLDGPPQAFCIKAPEFKLPPVIHGPQHIVFAGDDRGFDPNATSFRTRQTVGVVPEQSTNESGVDTPPAEQVGESKSYAPDALADGKLTAADDDATLHDCHLLDNRAFASTDGMHVDVTRVNAHQVKAHLYGGAGNPLVFGAPAIDWDLNLTIDTSGSKPHWTLTGAHDGFPAYEVYVNGQTLYTYSPGPGPYGFGDILKLFPPLDVSVNTSGDLP